MAKRVGVTQPYLFRLFPSKEAIVVAALTRSAEDARQACERVTKGMKGRERALPRDGQPHGERLHAADLDAPRNAPDADAGIRRRGSHRHTGR
ncbi:hypothetical protein [Streptomyces sp. NBC_00009]|uniref:hypothetical protein n=1 Tax=Streptomyces sp. NBC_00009 TaxID=2975620 RepID=UPI00325349C9